MTKAKVADIFFSIQGEGIYAGSSQVFVRFYGCLHNCRFCDTHLTAYDKYTPLELFSRVKRFTQLLHRGAGFTQPYHSLCLTGGEPLLHKDFLKEFLRLLKYEGITIYLETNGIFTSALAQLIEDVDIVAMDFKLPSSTGMKSFWSEHEEFLKIALQKEVFIKMVICLRTDPVDLEQAIDLLLRLDAKDIPVVLQPNFFEMGKELWAQVRRLQRYCSRYLSCVQVIPQLHKLTGVK